MKASFDCIPCLIRQTIDAARLSTADDDLQRRVLDRVMQHYSIWIINFLRLRSASKSLK
jgi:uncharacterized protein with ATP-grasp and redox domains